MGLVAGKRFPAADAPAYIAAQVIGGLLAAATLFGIASGIDTFDIDSSVPGAFAANGFDDLSPGGYNLAACFLVEVVLTAVFLLVIMGTTRVGSPAGTAPIAIGLALTLIHLISIPVTNTSVNPARSTSQAVFAGGDYIPQLWLFWVAPVDRRRARRADLPGCPRCPGRGHRRSRDAATRTRRSADQGAERPRDASRPEG